MSKVAVLDTEKKVLAPCHPAVARKLLKAGKAAVFKRYPFTIILKRCILELEVQATPHQLCIDPGSKTTGIAIVDSDRNVIFAAEPCTIVANQLRRVSRPVRVSVAVAGLAICVIGNPVS